LAEPPQPTDVSGQVEAPEAPELPDQTTSTANPTRTEPVFSFGLFKAILVLLVAGGLGIGGFALGEGGIDVDLPDLPELPEVTDPVTTLENTSLENTTIDGEQTGEATEPTPPTVPPSPFSSAGLGTAIERVEAEAGAGLKLQKLSINDVQTQFVVQRGDEVEAYSVRAENNELTREEASITISGNATLDDFAFALGGVEPVSVDRMLAKARRMAGGVPDFEPTVLNLERNLSAGLRPPEWTISAEGGGRNLTYRASLDGRRVEDIGGGGTEIPQAALDARKLNDCITAADQDFEAIQACFQEFSGGG
jgi:hypothetical protein